MTDNEIIKALECCDELEWCNHCPLRGSDNCRDTLSDNALDLINRQKAEIEKLKFENLALSQKRITMFERIEIVNNARTKAIKEFAENLKLKADRESVRKLVNYGNYWGRTMRIPEDSKAYTISYKISEADFDDLVKEMTEESNDQQKT